MFRRTTVIALSATLLFIAGTTKGAELVSASAMVTAHNQVRSKAGVPALSWSKALAADAAVWADELAFNHGCKMQHAQVKDQGENLYWASPTLWSDGRREVQPITPGNVVAAWASEKRDYDYDHNRCSEGKACGHYTQVVWKGTTQVGCAKTICPDQGQIWVCRYQPPGNWVGRRPY